MTDKAAWLAERKKFLTASDVAAVMGLDPHKKRDAVLRLKAGIDQAKDIERIPAVAAGRHLEAGILAWFAEDHQDIYSRVAQNGHVLRQSKLLPVLAATVDGYASPVSSLKQDDLVEVKCVDKPWAQDGRGAPTPLSVRNVGRAAAGDAAPLKYWVQLQVQLHCCGLRYGWLTGLQGAHSRADRLYELDTAFEARMLDAVRDFWQEVLALKALEGE